MIDFVLEESSWHWDGAERDAYVEMIEALLDRLDVIRDRGERYAASRELLAQDILEHHSLADLIWDAGLPLRLPPEVRERIAVHLGILRYWDDELDWVGIEVEVRGYRVTSPSAALAHSLVSTGRPVACLPLGQTWSGPCPTVLEGRMVDIHFVLTSERIGFSLEVPSRREAAIRAI